MSHRRIYWIVGGVLAVLLVVMLVRFNYNRSNEEAVAKAEQLITAFDKAGLRDAGGRSASRQGPRNRRWHGLRLGGRMVSPVGSPSSTSPWEAPSTAGPSSPTGVWPPACFWSSRPTARTRCLRCQEFLDSQTFAVVVPG